MPDLTPPLPLLLALVIGGCGAASDAGVPLFTSPSWTWAGVDQDYAFLGGGFYGGPSEWGTARAEGGVDRTMGHFQGVGITGSGDLNGDGFADVAASAPYWDDDDGDQDVGRVFVFYGGPGGLADEPDLAIDAPAGLPDERFGYSISLVGDVNTDGMSDLLVGAPGWAVEARSGDPASVSFSPVLGNAPACYIEWTTVGEPEAERCNGGTGDADDTGACSAATDPLEFADSVTYAYAGSDGWRKLSSDCDAYVPPTSGATATWVCTAGSLCDGIVADESTNPPTYYYKAGSEEDCLAPVGAAYLYLGGDTESGGMDATPDWQTRGEQVDNCSGESNLCEGYGNFVGGVGDVNADGYSDFAVSDQAFDESVEAGGDGDACDTDGNQGRVYVYLGAASGVPSALPWRTMRNPDPSGGPGGPYGIPGDAPFNGKIGCEDKGHFGSAVAGGDFDGDGYADLAIGADHFESGGTWEWDADDERYEMVGSTNNEGAVYLYSGAALSRSDYDELGADPYSGAVAGRAAPQDECDGHYGAYLNVVDTDRDGMDDLLVTAQDYGWVSNSNPGNKGEICKGGGFKDHNTCARGDRGGVNDEGAVYIYRGGAGALGSTGAAGTELTTPPAMLAGAPDRMITPPAEDPAELTENSNFGQYLAGIGDINGDGYADLVVGARMYGVEGSTETDTGKGYVYLGTSAGIGATYAPLPSETFGPTSSVAYAQFGRVAFAGDVNGDGVGDVLTAANAWSDADEATTAEGKLFLYTGAETGETGAW